MASRSRFYKSGLEPRFSACFQKQAVVKYKDASATNQKKVLYDDDSHSHSDVDCKSDRAACHPAVQLNQIIEV